MGRMYSIVAEVGSVTTAQDLLRISAAAGHAVKIHSVNVSNESTETSDSGAIQLQRSSNDGTGTSNTPEPLDAGDAAFGGTAVDDLSADTTISGSPLFRKGFNVLAGCGWIFPPESRPVVPPSGRFVVRSDVDLTGATLTVEVVLEELG